MKTITKKSITRIVMTVALLTSFLYSGTGLYANSPSKHKLVKTDLEKIAKQVEKINNYSELLKTSDDKESESIHRRIGNSQTKIRFLEDKLLSEENVNKHQAMNLPFVKYNFDWAENSLAIDDFSAGRDGNMDKFHLRFKTAQQGSAKIDFVSPGGELLKSISKSDYNGSFGEEILLSAERGAIYFVHINVDGKKNTKKLRFE